MAETSRHGVMVSWMNWESAILVLSEANVESGRLLPPSLMLRV